MELLCRKGPHPNTSYTYEERESDVIRVLSYYDQKERGPDQFRETDDNGSLPIHIAATFMCRHFMEGRSLKKYEHYQRYTSTIVGFLLQEYPMSVAIPDRQGRLPLQIASEHKLPCYEV